MANTTAELETCLPGARQSNWIGDYLIVACTVMTEVPEAFGP